MFLDNSNNNLGETKWLSYYSNKFRFTCYSPMLRYGLSVYRHTLYKTTDLIKNGNNQVMDDGSTHPSTYDFKLTNSCSNY